MLESLGPCFFTVTVFPLAAELHPFPRTNCAYSGSTESTTMDYVCRLASDLLRSGSKPVVKVLSQEPITVTQPDVWNLPGRRPKAQTLRMHLEEGPGFTEGEHWIHCSQEPRRMTYRLLYANATVDGMVRRQGSPHLSRTFSDHQAATAWAREVESGGPPLPIATLLGRCCRPV